MNHISERIRLILSDIESVQQDLLDLEGQIWSSIDFTDNEALDAGTTFVKNYNEEVESIDRAAQTLVELIEGYVESDLKTSPDLFSQESDQNERIVQALDRRKPHHLGEDFTFKRPYGFVLRGVGHKNVRTWKALYERVCHQLARDFPDSFPELPQMDRLITNRGNHYFSTDPSDLRTPRPITSDVYAETHFSANGLRDRIRELLEVFDITDDEFIIYLREDRDAE